MKVKFEKVENGREQYACYIPDRLYVLEKAGRLTGEYWQIIQYSEDLTSRPKTFPTMKSAAAAARQVSLSEMSGVPKEVAEIMLQLVCEAETADKYVFQDKDGDRWIMDKRSREAKKVEKKEVVKTVSSMVEAVREGQRIAQKYIDDKKERSKWAWNY